MTRCIAARSLKPIQTEVISTNPESGLAVAISLLRRIDELVGSALLGASCRNSAWSWAVIVVREPSGLPLATVGGLVVRPSPMR
jgi:hypothetical protein